MAASVRSRPALVVAGCLLALTVASPVAGDDIYQANTASAPPSTPGIGELHPMTPKRVLSTGSSGRLTRTVRVIQVAGIAPIPATGVAAIAVNLTASSST